MVFDPLAAVVTEPTMAPEPVSPNWLQRNWKWAVPASILGILALICAFIVGLLALVFGSLRSSSAVRVAISRAEADIRLVQHIGKPIKVGWLVTGSFHTSGSSSEADLKLPISGPKGEGILYIVGASTADKWTFTTLEIQMEGASERIDLLDHSPPRVDQTKT